MRVEDSAGRGTQDCPMATPFRRVSSVQKSAAQGVKRWVRGHGRLKEIICKAQIPTNDLETMTKKKTFLLTKPRRKETLRPISSAGQRGTNYLGIKNPDQRRAQRANAGWKVKLRLLPPKDQPATKSTLDMAEVVVLKTVHSVGETVIEVKPH